MNLGEKEQDLAEFVSEAEDPDDRVCREVVAAFLRGRGNKKATDVEVEQIYMWVRRVQTDVAVIGLIQKGLISIDIRDGEIWYSQTAEGVRVSEELDK